MLARRSTVLLAACALFAQAPAVRPAFEAATIKRNHTLETGGGMDLSPGRLSIENRALKDLIQQAYSVKRYLILGGPAWAETEEYDILGKAEGRATGQEMLMMLQTLLEDRFQLKFHRETKDRRGYRLVVLKNTPKFHETRDDDPRPARFLTRSDEFDGPKVSMAYFANYLAGNLDTLVLDRTGLTAKYDLHLVFTPEGRQPKDPGALSPASLFTALQDQLGLKLEPAMVPAELFVIDHATRPTEN